MSRANGVLQKIQRLLEMQRQLGGFGRVMDRASAVKATESRVDYEYEVKEEDCNAGMTLHGGLTASLVDSLTTITHVVIGNGEPGVSVNLDIQYLRAAKLGEKITIETTIPKTGRTLAFLEAKVRNDKGDLVAIGNHVKFVG